MIFHLSILFIIFSHSFHFCKTAIDYARSKNYSEIVDLLSNATKSFHEISPAFMKQIESHVLSFCPNTPHSKIENIAAEIDNIIEEQIKKS